MVAPQVENQAARGERSSLVHSFIRLACSTGLVIFKLTNQITNERMNQ